MLMQHRWAKFLLVLIAAIALLSCGGAEERKARYLERGKSYLAEKNYDKARIELKNVLQIDPKSAEAYYLLGQVEEGAGTVEKAYGAYSKAIDLNPEHLQANLKIARIYVMAHQTDKAAEKVDVVLKKQPDNTEAKLIRSVILSQKGNEKEALKLALEVAKAEPKEMEAVLLVAALYKKGGDTAKAMAVLEQAAVDSPKDIRLLATMAQMHAEQKNVDKAVEFLQKIVAVEPDVLDHRIKLALFLTKSGRTEQAEQVLRDAIKADPADSKRYLLLVEYLVNQKRAAEGESELLAAVEANPKDMKLRFGLAKLYTAMSKPDKVEAVYRKIIEIDGLGPDGMTARTQLAELLLGQGKTVEAGTLLAEVLKENPQDTGALLIRGKLHMVGDKPDPQAAVADFRSVLKAQPDSVEVMALLADAHQLNHEPDLAREILQRAIKAAPADVNARVRLARFLRTNDKDLEGALKTIDEYPAGSPKNLMLLVERMDVLAAMKDDAGIAETLAQIKKTYPDKPAGYYMAGEYYAARGKLQEAVDEFEQARQKAPDEFGPVRAISRTWMQMNKPADAIKALDAYLAKKPGHMDALQVKAGALAAMKDMNGLKKVIEDIKRLHPAEAAGYFLAGEYYLGQKDYENARREYGAAGEKSPDDARITQAMVKTWLAEKNPDGALAWLTQTDKQKPGNGYVHFLMGEVLLSQDKPAEAEQELQKAVQMAPKREDVYVRLADARLQQNHPDLAVKAVQQGVSAVPDSDNLRLKLASVYEAAGRFDEAIAGYEEVLKKNPGNILVANNLASLLTDHRSDPASLERARQLAAPFEASDQAPLLDTLGWVYYKLGDQDKALPLLKKAVNAAPELAVLRFHLGMAYYKKGDKAAARTELTRTLALDEKFPGADEARATLKALQ